MSRKHSHIITQPVALYARHALLLAAITACSAAPDAANNDNQSFVEDRGSAGSGGSIATESWGGANDGGESGAAIETSPAPACTTGNELDARLYAPDSCPFSKSMGEWAGAWWSWAMMIPESTNPILGGDCAQNQSGDVWFLAGTNGTTEQRDCAVPAGKSLFFPLINAECNPCPEDEGCNTLKTEAELRACAVDSFSGETPDVVLEIDGQTVDSADQYEISSGLFSWPGLEASEQTFTCSGPIPANNCGIPEGDRYAATYGWYVMLKPLAAGEHTIHFGGAVSFFGVDVTYTLVVE